MELLLVAYTKWIGITAGLFTACSLMPPLIRLIKEKKTDRLPVGMLIVLLAGLFLWIYYGILKKDWPLIITNSFSVLQNLTMLTLGFIYKNNK